MTQNSNSNSKHLMLVHDRLQLLLATILQYESVTN